MMKLRWVLLMAVGLCVTSGGSIQAQATTQAVGGGGGGLCDERCRYLSTPLGSGWGCERTPGLGEGWSCQASTDICTILLPSGGCPFALIESAIRSGEQYVQLCLPAKAALRTS